MIRIVVASWRPFALGAVAGAAVAVWYYRDERAAAVLGAGLVAGYLVDLLLDVAWPAAAPWWTWVRAVLIVAMFGATVATMLRFYPRAGPPHRAAHRVGYVPVHFAGRLAKNADMPSRKSLLV